MCGIAGHIGSVAPTRAQIDACFKRMGRRGPDATGLYQHRFQSGRQATLLHSRLSIIDLDPRANQPYRLGSLSLVFNGELYNYVEHKQRLMAEGVSFTSTSDTEVFMQMVARSGLKALDQCEGMWAFALYDEKDGSLTLSRDRFGEKPLYIYRNQNGFYFGSEIKFITALSGHTFQVNYDHLFRYLVNGYKSLYKKPTFFFKELSEIPRASVLRLGADGSEKSEAYWVPRFEPNSGMTYAEAVAGTRERLIDAVKTRLRADVPLAFCMSGGVDSNSLIGIAKRVFNYDVHGFTIMNTDERYEEQELVEYSAKALGIRHTNIPVQTKDFIPRLRRQIQYHDAPICTITYYAHWLLMESIAAHGYKISLSGTAADELFSGYYDHHQAYLYEMWKADPARYKSARAEWEQHIKPIVRNPFLQNPDAFVQRPEMRDHIFLGNEGFAQFLKVPWSEPFAETHYCDSLFRNRMMNEMFHENVPVILHEDDLNAMYYSIENRSPFLDRKLFEFAYSIPNRHLVRDGMAKAVLRDAMQGIAPDRIIESRRKVGFNAPIFSFLDVQDAEVKDYLLGESPIFDLVKRDKMVDLIAKASLPNSESKFLFYFLNCKIFVEEFAS